MGKKKALLRSSIGNEELEGQGKVAAQGEGMPKKGTIFK